MEMKDRYKFPMHTKEGVETFLLNYHNLKSSAFSKGDYDALIMLVDFELALLESELTVLELVTLERVFIEDLKRVDVAEEMGVTKQTIQTRITRATEKLAKSYLEGGDVNVPSESTE